MKKLIITALFVIQLFAQTPFIYSTLGDKIYNNAQNIEKLKFLLEYESNKDKITKYIKDVEEAKKIGFKIENEKKAIDKGTYLKILRELSSRNDFYINKINDNFINSVNSENNVLFLQSINSGLLDIPKNKKVILKYYNEHKESIDAIGVLKNIIKEHKNKKPVRRGLTSAELEKIEIERIRKRDKAQQRNIERSLEEEVIRKKIEIRKEQKEELGIKTK